MILYNCYYLFIFYSKKTYKYNPRNKFINILNQLFLLKNYYELTKFCLKLKSYKKKKKNYHQFTLLFYLIITYLKERQEEERK